jgi:hypothetical protein
MQCRRNHEFKHSQMNNKVPQNQLTLTLERPRERERGESRGGTLVHGDSAGEDGRLRRVSGDRRREE